MPAHRTRGRPGSWASHPRGRGRAGVGTRGGAPWRPRGSLFFLREKEAPFLKFAPPPPPPGGPRPPPRQLTAGKSTNAGILDEAQVALVNQLQRGLCSVGVGGVVLVRWGRRGGGGARPPPGVEKAAEGGAAGGDPPANSSSPALQGLGRPVSIFNRACEGRGRDRRPAGRAGARRSGREFFFFLRGQRGHL